MEQFRSVVNSMPGGLTLFDFFLVLAFPAMGDGHEFAGHERMDNGSQENKRGH